ncbi:NitT/TauT family transport system substrate-binding protein [Arthrobacter sp. V4I6]|uniref:ABC transporter substrate-binding protein n=1 Tax=unclassified Arthrobacter TaxID=235627 RepID=UPI0027870F0E|nr:MULTISPECIES: ABC transporter substrate-binding protein [unclassified Arthrobacter]MDQ0823658.1 NitT/TauT family transport system substrate-binding protein [Arthrobacter sp. V1I7]MDQ0853291.1 NitT/TauT family transport system substrate-binding protein [Arthrobacter sp. V4I6]
MRKTMLVAALAAASISLAGCGTASTSPAGTEGDSSVEVGIVQLPIFAPIYVAKAKGYFEDEGLNVNLQTVKSGSDAVPLASSGKLDVVAAGFSAGMFSAIKSGLNIKITGSMGVSDGNTEASPTDLVVSKAAYDAGSITSVADLKGKNVGAAGGTGGAGAYLLSLALKDAGLSLNDVKVVNLGNPDMPTAISNGGLDAGLISAPFSSVALKEGVGVSLGVPPAGTSGTGVIFGDQFAETDKAQKFFNAIAKASKDLQGENRYSDENLKIIAGATGQTPEEVKAVPLYTWLPDLKPLPEQLADMESVWMQAGALEYDQPLPQDTYIDTSFAENVK